MSFVAGLSLPAGSVVNADIALDVNNLISSSKAERQRVVHLSTAIGTDVTAIDQVVHIFDGAATIEDVSIVAETAPAGGDLKVVVDVELWSPSAWTTVLTGDEDVDTGYTDNTRQSITLDGTPTAVAGDLLRITVTVSGSTGTQAQGLCVAVKFTENP